MRKSENEDRLNAFFSTLSDELSQSQRVHSYARDRLLSRMRKRAGFVNPALDDLAISKFLATNKGLAGYEVKLDTQIERDAKHFILVMLERFSTTLSDLNIQVPLDAVRLYDYWRFGPGASNGVRGTHTAEKLEQPMTTTARCEPYVKRLRALNHYLSAKDGESGKSGVTLIYGSRLTTVPKNEDTVRTIAIEPSGNMAMQLAAGRYLEGVLRYIGCDISKQQPLNKALARKGSVDGALCTIDLSSASDMISIDLVRRLLPKPWFELLMNVRSPLIEVRGELVEMNMISTMGNGFTFPLMTLIIISLIYGFRAQRGGPTLYMDWSQTAVFGDDIIITTDEYAGFCEVLQQAGLVVNHDKSYSEGKFRESCGGDYYEGYDVTPFYVRNLQTDSELYVAANQLLEWSARNFFVPVRSLRLLVQWLRRGPFVVPEWHNPDQGILCAQVPREYKYLSERSQEIRYTGSFAMMLAVGGYLTPSGSRLFYTPRSSRRKVCTRVSRLPHGYLDGADCVKRSVVVSSRVSLLVSGIVS